MHVFMDEHVIFAVFEQRIISFIIEGGRGLGGKTTEIDFCRNKLSKVYRIRDVLVELL